MEILDRYDISPELAWVGSLVVGVVAVVAAAIAFTRQVFWGFLWHYFWGPVHADAVDSSCVVYRPDVGSVQTGEMARGCDIAAYDAAGEAAYVATPGYTVVSTLGYVAVLVFMLVGVYLLLRRFDLSPHPKFFYALVPFMLFGGALRTVEDSFVAAQEAGVTPAMEYPLSAALISPFIYFTVFAIALGAFLLGKWLAHTGRTETYYYPLGTIGAVALFTSFGYLLSVAATESYVRFYPGILLVTLVIATIVAAGTYFLTERYRPWINAGTGLMGLVVLWGHAIDGTANVLANDWTHVWGLGEYSAKHPLNRTIMDLTNSIQGGTELFGVYVGEAWPFLVVKILVPLAIISVFDKQFIEENPRYAIMLLGAIVAVGLGPGTRDMVRVTFGI
ncbi:DUF63 family protein [Halovenus marina]|uniref:DUF63 family protein n=1 Tax=Halovenus marina TaxID=3396621 RepID=UPI003F563C44